jgi:hypothetical protein
MMNAGIEKEIAEVIVQVLRNRLMELEQLAGKDEAPEGIDAGLSLVRNLLARVESEPVLHWTASTVSCWTNGPFAHPFDATRRERLETPKFGRMTRSAPGVASQSRWPLDATAHIAERHRLFQTLHLRFEIAIGNQQGPDRRTGISIACCDHGLGTRL